MSANSKVVGTLREDVAAGARGQGLRDIRSQNAEDLKECGELAATGLGPKGLLRTVAGTAGLLVAASAAALTNKFTGGNFSFDPMAIMAYLGVATVVGVSVGAALENVSRRARETASTDLRTMGQSGFAETVERIRQRTGAKAAKRFARAEARRLTEKRGF